MKAQMAIYFGGLLGTFLLFFFATATAAVSVLFNASAGLVEVAIIWGVGVTLAIYATRHLSCAHLNPTVSLGMVLTGRMQPRLLLPYWGELNWWEPCLPAPASSCFSRDQRFIGE